MWNKIKCFFGFHDWLYGRNAWFIRTRECKHCGYYQEEL